MAVTPITAAATQEIPTTLSWKERAAVFVNGRFLLIGIGSIAGCFILSFALAYLFWWPKQERKNEAVFEQFPSLQTKPFSGIYDKDGNWINSTSTKGGHIKKLTLPAEAFSETSPLAQALATTEDRPFFRRAGSFEPISGIKSILRAGKARIIDGRKEGASNIWWQAFKLAINEVECKGEDIKDQKKREEFRKKCTQDRGLTRKLRESIGAVKLERLPITADGATARQQVMAYWANNAYMGFSFIGVGTAALAYFDKDLSKNSQQLTLEEAAFIATIFNGAGNYLTCTGKGKAYRCMWNARTKLKRDLILQGMYDEGYIPTKAELAKAQGAPLPSVPQWDDDKEFSPTLALGSMQAMREAGIQNASNRIVRTAIDQEFQDKAINAMRENINAARKSGQIKDIPGWVFLTGIVAVDEKGNVITYAGNQDFEPGKEEHDVLQTQIALGSIGKVPLYTLALQLGWSPNDAILDAPVSQVGNSYWPTNHGKWSSEPVTLLTGFSYSYNTVAVRLLRHLHRPDGWESGMLVPKDADNQPYIKANIDALVSVYKQLGFKVGFPGEAIVIAGTTGTPLDVAGMMLAIKNGGYHQKLYPFTGFADEVFTRKAGKQVFAPEACNTMRNVFLREVVAHGTASKGSQGFLGFLIGKTGSSGSSAWLVSEVEGEGGKGVVITSVATLMPNAAKAAEIAELNAERKKRKQPQLSADDIMNLTAIHRAQLIKINAQRKTEGKAELLLQELKSGKIDIGTMGGQLPTANTMKLLEAIQKKHPDWVLRYQQEEKIDTTDSEEN